MIVHAGLIALHGAGGWRGVLVEGPSGAGKSDLALRALDLGFRLVSDDRALLWASEDKLYGACPPAIAGLMEARGLGLVSPPHLRPFAEVALLAVCVPPEETIDRLPEPETRQWLGLSVPVLRLHALEASAPLKIRWALSHLGARPLRSVSSGGGREPTRENPVEDCV